MTLATGTVLIDRYRIVRLLGQGGFGAVYRVWDLHLNAPYALKENLDASPEATRQFAREAQILANLHHPHLPRVTDHFSIPDQGQYLVMEFVEGEDLEEKRCTSDCMPKGSLPVSQVMTWILQIMDALEYLHQQNPPIIHRDIKPANIRITPQGKACLVDFGIAKIFSPLLKTTIGARAITPGYSPLEQYGQGVTDARSDIYALGATLYVLLTGQTPPESTARAWNDPLLPAGQLNPSLSPAVSQAINKAMKADPADRWQNIAELRQALQQAAPTPAPVGAAHLPTVKEVAPDVVLVSPVKLVAATTPMEAALPAQPASRENIPPTRVVPPKRKSPRLLLLVGGAVLFLCVGFIIAANILGKLFGFSYPTATSGSALVTNPTKPSASIPTLVPYSTSGPLKIGLLAPLTGSVSGFGKSAMEGAVMAVQEWNDKGGVLGRQILLLPEDSQCKGDIATSAANKLIVQQGVKYLVGDICSNGSIPVAEIANQNNVVQISPTSTNRAVTEDSSGNTRPYTFRACFIDLVQGEAMARFAIQQGYKSVFIMSDDYNEYVTGLADAFQITFGEAGGRIAGRASHTAQTTDFSTTLDKVAASGADILYIPDYYQIVNLVAAQAKKRGLKAVLMGGDGWDSADLDLKALEGGFFSNHYSPDDKRPIFQEWVKRYGSNMVDEQGKPKMPDAIATLTYDATNMLLEAIRQAGEDKVGRVVYSMAKLHWEGVSGTMSFDEHHNPVKPVVIVSIRGGRMTYFATLYP
jgi:branched-chain amino acid transport system substrate-binding protein